MQLDTATLGTKSGEITFSNNDADENPFNFQITGTVLMPPEVTVLGNGISIADGDATPSTTDGTDFQFVVQGGSSLSRTFTVRNDGAATLTLGAVAVPTGFALTESLSSSLAPGASDTFTVQLETVTAGIWAGDVSFANNDSDENPFNFRIMGTVDAGHIVIDDMESYTDTEGSRIFDIWMDGRTNDTGSQVGYATTPFAERVIVHGGAQSMPLFYDNTHTPYYSETSRTFAVTQDWTASGADSLRLCVRGQPTNGVAPLYVAVQDTAGHMAVQTCPGEILQTTDHWAEWLISLSRFAGADLSSVKTMYLGIGNRQNPVADGSGKILVDDITLRTPEITVLGNGVTITDGDTTPSTTDGTDFGSVSQGGTGVSRVFTVSNNGMTVLTLGTVTMPPGFTLTEGLSISLAPGASDTFTVRLDTNATGTKTGAVSFSTNDYDENPFNFRITGTVLTGPNLALGRPAVASTSLADLPASNVTDGDASSRWSSEYSASEWIYVDLGLVCTVDRIVLRWEDAYGRGYRLHVSNDASMWSDVYSTTSGDGGVDDIALSTPASGRYVRMLGTQRATVYGYSLYELEVYGVAPRPEITVLGNDVSITDGDTTPSTTDGTDFSSVVQGEAAVSRTFTVRNDGTATLTLGVVTVPTGFTLTEGLSASLGAGESDAFTVRLGTATVGTKTGDITFSTNDSDENPFNFSITGTVLGVPEITVLGNDVSIADGDVTPSTADGTDFGSVAQGEAVVSRTFTVRNDGTGTLTLGAVTVPTGYTLTEGLSGSLAAGASDSFTVRLDTATPGTKTGDVSFTTNDSDENPFSFRITGTVVVAGANLAAGRPAVASTSYTGLPAANATDGNAGSRWSSQFSNNEWIYVDLGSTYTINRVVLRWETAYGRGYKIQVSSNASTWSDVHGTTTGDGGVDDITLTTPAAGRYVRMLGTQRATTFGYSLYEFEVYGGPAVNHAPVVSGFSKSTTQNTPLPFAAGDFAGTFTDPDAGDSLQKVKITSLPGHGTLMLNSAPVSVDQEIPAAQIGTLTYTPASGYTGPDSFQWNGSDGSLYAASAAAVNLTVNPASANLALGKTVVASTSYTGFPPSNVTDGNTSSRWSSQFSDSQWLYVDLGSVYTIKQVVLRWEAAYGRGYKLQVSSDASSWSDVYSTTTGDGGVDDIKLSAPTSGRYVRLLGTQRATTYGYSLYELEVYAAPPNLVLGKPAVASTSYTGFPASNATDGNTSSRWSCQFSDSQWLYVDLGSVYAIKQVVLRWESAYGRGYKLQVSSDASTWSDVYSTTTGDGGVDNITLTTPASGRYVRMLGTQRATTYGYSLYELEVYAAPPNLALGMTAAASTSYTGMPPSNATDGNPGTRWSSQFSDSQWLYVDLGSVYTIRQVVLRWEAAYGRGYKLQVSNDASAWSDVYSTTTGDGGVDDITLGSPASGRYLRLLGTQRGSTFGYSLWEFEVYG